MHFNVIILCMHKDAISIFAAKKSVIFQDFGSEFEVDTKNT